MCEKHYTLNLPATDFPMRGELPKKEPLMLEQGQKDNVYELIRKSREGKPLFVLHDGPPYANAAIHIGHALNKVLKDVIIKAKTLEGFDAPYVPGWDCHGLPIELKVENLVGKPGINVDAKEFRLKCREYAIEQVDLQRKDFVRLGIFGDGNNPYLTMNYDTEAEIIRTLSKLVQKNHMFKGHKPVYGCVDCKSALAEAEVEYHNKKSESIYVAFLAHDQVKTASTFEVDAGETPVFAMIWTTTPGTIPGDRAISVNKDFEYVLVKAKLKDNKYFAEEAYFVLCKDLLESVATECNFESYEVVGKPALGKDLELQKFHHPLYHEMTVPVVLGEHVGVDAGTGLVHTAPDHGIEDFHVCKEYGIGLANILTEECRFKESVPKFAGLQVFESNVPVIKELAYLGRLVNKSSILHSYPHCWRHKTPVIYRATPQGFIGMDVKGLRKDVLNEIQKVKFFPAGGQARIEGMVSGRPDWCISRQRTGGVPIPVFTHKETEELHPNTFEIFEKVAKLVEKNGIQAGGDASDEELIGEDAGKYYKAKDTLDVGFDSGATSQTIVAKRPEYKGHTSDLYLEGSDQHRGWFMSSICIGTGVTGHSPYKQVLTHGFVVDGNGNKMSKSLGNVVAPQEVNNQYGADILRLWITQTDYTTDIKLSPEILKRSVEQYRRIRNTIRFLLANLNDFNPETDLVDFQDMLPIDRYMVGVAYKLQEEVRKNYDNYQFHLLVKSLMKFCSIDLGSFYLDIVKDRIYIMKADSQARRSCQTAMYNIAEALIRWFTPICSFTSQEAWEKLPGKHDKYVFTQYYYENLALNDSPFNDEFGDKILELRELVNNKLEPLRKDKVIGSSLDAKVTIRAKREIVDLINRLESEAKFMFLVSELVVEELNNDENQEEIVVVAEKHLAPKCELTWHHDVTVGLNKEHPTLCQRAIENLFGNGEVRKYC